MPFFGKQSLEKLSQCHPDLVKVAQAVIKFLDMTVLEGRRGKEEQEKAFNEGRSKAHYGESAHNAEPPALSEAFDIAPFPIVWPDQEKDAKKKIQALCRFYYMAGRIEQAADELFERKEITSSLRWGGDWDSDNDFSDQTFDDLPHFERAFWKKKTS